MLTYLRGTARQARNIERNWRVRKYLRGLDDRGGRPTVDDFDFVALTHRVLRFIDSMGVNEDGIQYRYSSDCTQPTLYSSVYACMTLSLLGRLRFLPPQTRNLWIEYFDSFQNPDDGLFYDPTVRNDLYDRGDWWGARHLAVHMIAAYTALGARPKHPFRFLASYENESFIHAWLEKEHWDRKFPDSCDIDNQIMNIGCLLQYQRDYWNDRRAGDAVTFLKQHLLAKINRKTALWGGYDSSSPSERSRMIQFAYHLLSIFFYDDDIGKFHAERVCRIALATQNLNGGFGVHINSSACEDVDSIDIMVRLSHNIPATTKLDVQNSLRTAIGWILTNQVEDGGFVFRLCESFRYGSSQMSSAANKGAMFPTWFRTLSLAYLSKHLGLPNEFHVNRCPGYEF